MTDEMNINELNTDQDFIGSRRNRYRLRFEKTGRPRFIGHLDMLKLFERAVRMARLPVMFSKGFNPHIVIAMAQPLALGHESLCEYLELQLTRSLEPDSIVGGLNAVLPEGVRTVNCRALSLHEKAAAALVSAAAYDIALPFPAQTDRFESAAALIMGSDTLPAQKRTKSGVFDADIRGDIYSLKIYRDAGRAGGGNIALSAVIACGSARNLKPELLVRQILECAGLECDMNEIRYVRTRLLTAADGGLTDLT